MAEHQIPSGNPPPGHSPPDLTVFANGLRQDPDGIWRGCGPEAISYPAAGNSDCFTVEDSSFWFAHRNACLLALLRRFPAAGPFFDIGGGNGFVAAALQSQGGLPVVLVEPGADGVRHAEARGLRAVVQATLTGARFRDRSLPAIGFFDVLEHIEDEQGFLGEIRRCLAANGRIYLSVPAGRWLWSDADVQAGHFRRYTPGRLRAALNRAGFRPLFLSRIFSPLPLPLFLCRTLPSLFGHRRQAVRSYFRQHQPKGRTLMERVWRWEVGRLVQGKSIPLGTSCLAVAELSSYTAKESFDANQR
ncbi:MAG TPA: class I SAM-dependent methyltransferase [Candidatus Sulfopaludibacter sp.]|nr:class I SAM-dependent methyltransferase [Candidatus Sulfopaludibacter sp.]